MNTEYAHDFYLAQIGANISNLASNLILVVLVFAVARVFAHIWHLAEEDNRLRTPWSWWQLALASVGCAAINFIGGLIPSKSTIIATIVAEQGVDKAERIMTLLEAMK